MLALNELNLIVPTKDLVLIVHLPCPCLVDNLIPCWQPPIRRFELLFYSVLFVRDFLTIHSFKFHWIIWGSRLMSGGILSALSLRERAISPGLTIPTWLETPQVPSESGIVHISHLSHHCYWIKIWLPHFNIWIFCNISGRQSKNNNPQSVFECSWLLVSCEPAQPSWIAELAGYGWPVEIF